MSRDPVNIQRGEDPPAADTRKLRKAISRAKARGKTSQRPGDMQGTPRFDEIQEQVEMQPAPGANTPPPTSLSPETQAALAAMASTLPEEVLPEKEPPPRQLSPDQRMREAIEKRLRPIDIGQFLMNGFVTQEVPIIQTEGASLVVSFQTAKEALEVYIDARLAEEAASIRKKREESGATLDIEMSQREYIRRQNEWALAAQIKAYQGREWPPAIGVDGSANEDAMRMRLQKVRDLPSPVFVMVTQNLSWFIDRVSNSLTAAALGNG
jgi:hypothetical protein